MQLRASPTAPAALQHAVRFIGLSPSRSTSCSSLPVSAAAAPPSRPRRSFAINSSVNNVPMSSTSCVLTPSPSSLLASSCSVPFLATSHASWSTPFMRAPMRRALSSMAPSSSPSSTPSPPTPTPPSDSPPPSTTTPPAPAQEPHSSPTTDASSGDSVHEDRKKAFEVNRQRRSAGGKKDQEEDDEEEDQEDEDGVPVCSLSLARSLLRAVAFSLLAHFRICAIAAH
jgi:hypothetical protein